MPQMRMLRRSRTERSRESLEASLRRFVATESRPSMEPPEGGEVLAVAKAN